MCGIVGIINSNGLTINPQLLQSMCDAQKHRGPDDEGYFIHENVGLGHRRLSIIDLERGHQPIHNEDETIWIVFNGEIYNFQELRKQLEEYGHRFYTNTDTEVIVHAYEQFGEQCVTHLRGMFAFALWDGKQQKLLLARDRVGQKPLLYSHSNGRFVFASEFQAILQNPSISREVDLVAIDQYLTHTYVPAPLTAFKAVRKLLPGHILVYQDGQIRIERYWRLSFENKVTMDEEETAERIMELLTEAVKLRLISDVPLGVFLSGGIDSSAVVGLMSQLSDKPVKTFSIGFEEQEFNELDYARIIAQRFGTEHHEFIVKPQALEVLPILVRHYGEPYADSSAIPTFYVSQLTRQHVTVALNGDGGDESFAGYSRYLGLQAAANYSRIPKLLRNGLIQPISYLLPNGGGIGQIKRFIQFASLPTHGPSKGGGIRREELHLHWLSAFRPELKAELYSEDFRQSLFAQNPVVEGSKLQANSSDWWNQMYRKTAKLDTVDAALYVDILSYLPFDLLVKVDITSMANSLEARSPFLDHKLLEFSASLPSRFKLRGKTLKYILKQTLDGFIPNENIHRKKMGFGVPVGRWFRRELRDFLIEIVLSNRALKRDYFNPTTLNRLVFSHINGKQDYSYQMWTLLMLELWHREFID